MFVHGLSLLQSHKIPLRYTGLDCTGDQPQIVSSYKQISIKFYHTWTKLECTGMSVFMIRGSWRID